ncbi:MAG: hypothetical protein EBR02_10135, partial [Alphaproteobacteria bacterium]|nr:hypothetical protein [Alphaproteobacteria bacterium]
KKRPKLVIGFAAETEKLLTSASAKRKAKNCDIIVANDVSGGKGFDGDDNQVTLISARGNEAWPKMSKEKIAEKLTDYIFCHPGFIPGSQATQRSGSRSPIKSGMTTKGKKK